MMHYLLLIPMLLLQFTAVDKEFRDAHYTTCEQMLQEMLPQAAPGPEKAEVLWRLSRVTLMLAEDKTDKEVKRALYSQGIAYAEQAIQEDPGNSEGYMWHSGNVGRDCLTRGVTEQAAASVKVAKDLNTILNELNRADHASAWHALAELYWRHPFKSKDSAVNYARRAVVTIPADELRIITCLMLADYLYHRDWSTEKRAAQATAHAGKFTAGKNNIDKYAYYDGASVQLPWLKGSLKDVSDREEAAAVIRYAQQRYAACKDPAPLDRDDYRKLQAWIKRNNMTL